jgi:hypothetical protein
MSLNQREKSKMLGVWIPKEEYESLEEFLEVLSWEFKLREAP